MSKFKKGDKVVIARILEMNANEDEMVFKICEVGGYGQNINNKKEFTITKVAPNVFPHPYIIYTITGYIEGFYEGELEFANINNWKEEMGVPR